MRLLFYPTKNLYLTLIKCNIIIFFIVFFLEKAHADELTVSVDRNRIGSGETLQLLVKWDAQVRTDPDFSALQHDFEILSQQQQNQLSIVNGKTESHTSWKLELLPKRSGKLLIPSFNYKGAVSDAIAITIAEASQQDLSDTPVYVETLLDKDSLYVQEQLLLTHRIVTRVNLQGISNDELVIPDASVVKLSESQYQKLVNGVQHLVIELKYAIFPNNSGQLSIPSIRFSTVISDRRDPFSGSFFSRSDRRLFLSSDSRTVPVLPRPAASGQGEWLPSAGVSLSERWSRPTNALRAGEPVTRTVTLTAQGLTGVQLPPLTFPATESLKIYPDQPQLDDTVSANGVLGQRTETMALVPSKAGEITLPPVVVSWWDTKNQQLKQTLLEGRTLRVSPALGDQTGNAPGETDQPEPQAASADEQPEQQAPAVFSGWTLLLAITNLVLLALIAALLLARRGEQTDRMQTQASPRDAAEQSRFAEIRRAARGDDSAAFREAVLNWARVCWNRPDVNTLSTIAGYAGDQTHQQRLRDAFKRLDQYLFANESGPAADLPELVTLLETLRKQENRQPEANPHGLKPLYGR